MDVTILCYYLEDTLLIGLGNLPLEGEGEKSAWLWKGDMEK